MSVQVVDMSRLRRLLEEHVSVRLADDILKQLANYERSRREPRPEVWERAAKAVREKRTR